MTVVLSLSSLTGVKTSISVPDELWDCVKDAGDGPSAVVQYALTLLCEQRRDPMANAPSERVRERLRTAVAAQVERDAGAARQMSEEGYELGVAVAEHLSLVELLSLPPTVDGIERRLRYSLIGGDKYFRTPAVLEDFESWRDDHLDADDILWDNEGFWSHLDLAIERHVEAAADHEYSDVDGAVYLHFWGTLESGQWVHHETPTGWWVADGTAEVGRYFITEATLPSAYLKGIAGALADIRNAVDGLAAAEPSAPAGPGGDSLTEGSLQ